MPDWTAVRINMRRGGRLLGLGVITLVLVTALAGPAISALGPRPAPTSPTTRRARRASGLRDLRCGTPAGG